MNIVVFGTGGKGTGYKGYSIALYFAKYYKVTIVEDSREKIDKINGNLILNREKEIVEYFNNGSFSLEATEDVSVVEKADMIFICLPTDGKAGMLDTRKVEWVFDTIHSYSLKKGGPIIIKSTVPVGFTTKMINRYSNKNILFSPEFLRIGHSYNDLRNPKKLIVGRADDSDAEKAAKLFSKIYKCKADKEPVVLFTLPEEAEVIKLACNSYSALRSCFMSDIFKLSKKLELDYAKIEEGIYLQEASRLGGNNSSDTAGYEPLVGVSQLSELCQDSSDSILKFISSLYVG